MSRLNTMARFAEPDNEPEAITTCDCCTSDIYEGDEVVKFEGEVFCDMACFIKYMDIRTEPLEKGDVL